jgi:hypothetical protein
MLVTEHEKIPVFILIAYIFILEILKITFSFSKYFLDKNTSAMSTKSFHFLLHLISKTHFSLSHSFLIYRGFFILNPYISFLKMDSNYNIDYSLSFLVAFNFQNHGFYKPLSKTFYKIYHFSFSKYFFEKLSLCHSLIWRAILRFYINVQKILI